MTIVRTAGSRSSRALFLDIDGVLAPHGRENSDVLDEAALARAREIHRSAVVVLSSSWPIRSARAWGIPFDDALPDAARRAPPDDRFDGIAAWLAAHPEIRSWASLDDDPQGEIARDRRVLVDELLGAARFVRCSWRVCDGRTLGHGLDERSLERVRHALGVPWMPHEGPWSPTAHLPSPIGQCPWDMAFELLPRVSGPCLAEALSRCTGFKLRKTRAFVEGRRVSTAVRKRCETLLRNASSPTSAA